MDAQPADERITSNYSSPLGAAIQIVMLPTWALILILQLSRAEKTWWLIGLVIAMLVFSVPQLLRGLVILVQRVEADAAGIRMRGLGGFDVPWSAVRSLKAVAATRSNNVTMVLQPGQTVRSDLLLMRTGTRSFGVDPAQVAGLTRLAAAHGVQVAEPAQRPG